MPTATACPTPGKPPSASTRTIRPTPPSTPTPTASPTSRSTWPAPTPVAVDSDGDGLLDAWEITHEINPLSGLRADLAGWWRFAEASGAVVTDWSGQGRAAEILAPEHVSRVTGAPVGGALRFDGVSDDDYLQTS